METITQTYLAKQLKVSPAYINYLVNTIKRPNWNRAKQLARITKTTPELWLDGSSEKIKAALNNQSQDITSKTRAAS